MTNDRGGRYDCGLCGDPLPDMASDDWDGSWCENPDCGLSDVDETDERPDPVPADPKSMNESMEADLESVDDDATPN